MGSGWRNSCESPTSMTGRDSGREAGTEAGKTDLDASLLKLFAAKPPSEPTHSSYLCLFSNLLESSLLFCKKSEMEGN